MCVGMETLLTPEISRAVKERKRCHVRSVLLAQARQDFEGPVDVREDRGDIREELRMDPPEEPEAGDRVLELTQGR